jgi:hypothetical protein
MSASASDRGFDSSPKPPWVLTLLDPTFDDDLMDSARFRHRWFVWEAEGSGPDVRQLLVCPNWALTLAAALLPLSRLVNPCVRWRRRNRGLCPSCRYDLRATPGRCPECGTATSSVASASPPTAVPPCAAPASAPPPPDVS